MTSSSSSPTSATRVLASDIARGLMLLLIALANMPWHLSGYRATTFSAHDADGSALDRVWQAVAMVAIDGRSYPLFAFLFGYGIWQLYRRQLDAGADRRHAHRLLRRRHLWMLVFGAVHAALLWGGDILGAYGIVGLLVCWLFLDRGDRTIAIWAAILGGLLTASALLTLAVGVLVGPGGDVDGVALPSAAATDSYAESIVIRLGMWVGVTLGQGLLTLAVPVSVLVALLAARHRVLERPELFTRLLRRTAVGGVALAWAGGALGFAHVVGAFPQLPSWALPPLTVATGVAGGLGYAAIFALVGAAWQRRGVGRVGRALTAAGQRSMTCYLLQSALFAPVLSVWGLGLGGVLSEWQGALYAVAVWLVTLAVAVALERRRQRGPFERLLRHLAYPRTTTRPVEPVSTSTTASRR